MMKRTASILLASTFAALGALGASAAPATAAPLTVQVFPAPPGGFGVTATLVAGEKDAILIDSSFSLADAHRTVAAVLESKKNLTTIYVTHAHPDHYFGLAVITQAFPKAKLIATPATVRGIEKGWQAKVAQWQPMFGALVPSQVPVPTAIASQSLSVEGQALELVGPVQGDEAHNTYVWIPSIKTVIAGDIVFDGTHVWTAESSPADRKKWIATLDQIAALKPAKVVPGHQAGDAKQDPRNLTATRDYLRFFDEALASSKTSDELQAKVKAKYPALALDIILKFGADAAFAKPAKPAS